MANLQQDVEALDRVLFRLASVDDERMLQVLQSLLPHLLSLFPRSLVTPLELQLKDKILQVVAHIKTRLQALTHPTLPLDALCQVLQQTELSVFSYNLALLFIELGFDAALREQQTKVLAAIVKTISRFSAAQQETFFRLLVRAMPVSTSAIFPSLKEAAGGTGEQEEEQEKEASDVVDTVYEADANVDVVLDFLLDLVLYEPLSSTSGNVMVFGLTGPRVERLQRVKVSDLNREAIYERQLHALKLVKEMAISTKLKLPVYLAGSASFHHAVKTFSDEQLSRVIKYEETELEDADVARRLMVLVLGSQVAQSSGAFEGTDAILLANRTRLADTSILQTLTLLSASTVATNVLPMMLQLLCQLMFGIDPSRPPSMANKIKLASVRLCQWTFHHTQLALLEGLLGPVVFPTLLRLLMNPHTESEASSAEFVREFRQGVYESLSVLANRAPTLVATSEQAFQVLLVRCLAEEDDRTGVGADALKAFTSFASAYAAAATPEVRIKVIQELVALLNGSKLFDRSKNYSRVRGAIAAWCAELLTTSVPEKDDIALRFAVMRLESVPDEDTRRYSNKALFAKPFPSTGVLARSLQANFPQNLTTSMFDSAAERCVQFCVEILKAIKGSDTQEERTCVVEFITRILLRSTEKHAFHAARSSSIFETAANALVEVCGFDAESVSDILACQVVKLFDVASVSQDRAFLSNISAIVRCTCRAGALCVSQVVSDFIAVGTTRLTSNKASGKELSGVLYILGSVLSYIDSDTLVNAISIDDMQLILLCFQKMVNLLHHKVLEGSDFALYPRGERAQNEHLALLRSVLDGIGLSGTLTNFMRSSVGIEWSLLKAKTLEDLRLVVEWKLKAVHFDDQLSPKLEALKRVSIENLGRAVSGLSGVISTDLSSGVEAALNALLDLHIENDTELQFNVGEALVALGTHDSEEGFAVHRETKYDTFASNRAAAIFERVLADYVGSRQLKQRRNATVWFLCMCAAGLTTPSPENESAPVTATSWNSVFRSAAYSQSVLGVHEFFVTMLNDTNGVAKESAVKGLAYLRLRSPTDEMGTQFSESLFRRLRCFRAFASTSDAVDDEENGDISDRAVDGPTAPVAPASSSSSIVENAAYREVSNVAADVGDPELMYALLYLSTNDPIWGSLATLPASAAMLRSGMFSFVMIDKHFRASIVAKAGSQWMADDYSKKTKLIPWLFLLKFHSNSKVAAVMGSLWELAKGDPATVATVKGEKALLRPNWALLFQFALARLEKARNFKYREAACLALVDLLNGAEADELRKDFLRLWITASRAVDDVIETVVLAGVKLYRYLGETSLRIAASDALCSSQLLEFLVGDGIVSKNTICRALSIDVLLRLVKTLKASDIQNRLAPLLLKLLEYLSSLEMPELQYAQFHVEKKDQLERLRVSISQAGPVGQLLELATARLKDLAGSTGCVTVVAELVRGVANLLKFGVGLNTRVGTANFVITLAAELPFEIRKCNGAELLLRRVLLPYVSTKTAAENDQYGDEESRYGSISNGPSTERSTSTLAATSGLTDGLVIQSYCRAAAYLCPLVDATTVRDYVRSGIFAFNASSTSATKTVGHFSHDTGKEEAEADDTRSKSLKVYTSRFLLISALAMKELVKKVPPVADADTVVIDDLRNTWYCTHVFPAAFIGQFAATDALKSSWVTVLDELPPTILYSTRSLDAVLHAVALLLAHPAWDTRRQAARALQAIFASATYRSKLSMEQVARIWNELVDAVPGRLWRGKGVILESIVSLAAVKMENKASDNDDKWTEKLSLLLAEECARAWKNQDLAYLESAIVNLGKFSALLPAGQCHLRASNMRSLRNAFAEWMTGNELEPSEPSRPSLPPLLIKCVFEALAIMWSPLAATQGTTDSRDTGTAVETILWLCASVESPHLANWSVRRAIFQTLAAVVDRVPHQGLAESRNVVDRVVDSCCGSFGVADGKYSMVRVAAAGTLVALLKRAVHNSDVALKLVVQRERVSAAMQTLLESDEASEQQAAYNLKSQLLLMP